MTPFTNSTLENFEDGCIYHCEDQGWLPADGELDAEVDVCDGAVVVVTPLLIPNTFTACPCNPLWSMNDEMEGVVV